MNTKCIKMRVRGTWSKNHWNNLLTGPEGERIHQLKISSSLQELGDDLNNAQTEDAEI